MAEDFGGDEAVMEIPFDIDPGSLSGATQLLDKIFRPRRLEVTSNVNELFEQTKSSAAQLGQAMASAIEPELRKAFQNATKGLSQPEFLKQSSTIAASLAQRFLPEGQTLGGAELKRNLDQMLQGFISTRISSTYSQADAAIHSFQSQLVQKLSASAKEFSKIQTDLQAVAGQAISEFGKEIGATKPGSGSVLLGSTSATLDDVKRRLKLTSTMKSADKRFQLLNDAIVLAYAQAEQELVSGLMSANPAERATARAQLPITATGKLKEIVGSKYGTLVGDSSEKFATAFASVGGSRSRQLELVSEEKNVQAQFVQEFHERQYREAQREGLDKKTAMLRASLATITEASYGGLTPEFATSAIQQSALSKSFDKEMQAQAQSDMLASILARQKKQPAFKVGDGGTTLASLVVPPEKPSNFGGPPDWVLRRPLSSLYQPVDLPANFGGPPDEVLRQGLSKHSRLKELRKFSVDLPHFSGTPGYVPGFGGPPDWAHSRPLSDAPSIVELNEQDRAHRLAVAERADRMRYEDEQRSIQNWSMTRKSQANADANRAAGQPPVDERKRLDETLKEMAQRNKYSSALVDSSGNVLGRQDSRRDEFGRVINFHPEHSFITDEEKVLQMASRSGRMFNRGYPDTSDRMRERHLEKIDPSLHDLYEGEYYHRSVDSEANYRNAISRARTAAELARAGHTDQAQGLIQNARYELGGDLRQVYDSELQRRAVSRLPVQAAAGQSIGRDRLGQYDEEFGPAAVAPERALRSRFGPAAIKNRFKEEIGHLFGPEAIAEATAVRDQILAEIDQAIPRNHRTGNNAGLYHAFRDNVAKAASGYANPLNEIEEQRQFRIQSIYEGYTGAITGNRELSSDRLEAMRLARQAQEAKVTQEEGLLRSTPQNLPEYARIEEQLRNSRNHLRDMNTAESQMIPLLRQESELVTQLSLARARAVQAPGFFNNLEVNRLERALEDTRGRQGAALGGNRRSNRDMSMAMLQMSYGVQDFFQVTAQPGMGPMRGILAAANNMAPMLMMLRVSAVSGNLAVAGLLAGMTALNLMTKKEDDAAAKLNQRMEKLLQTSERLSRFQFSLGMSGQFSGRSSGEMIRNAVAGNRPESLEGLPFYSAGREMGTSAQIKAGFGGSGVKDFFRFPLSEPKSFEPFRELPTQDKYKEDLFGAHGNDPKIRNMIRESWQGDQAHVTADEYRDLAKSRSAQLEGMKPWIEKYKEAYGRADSFYENVVSARRNVGSIPRLDAAGFAHSKQIGSMFGIANNEDAFVESKRKEAIDNQYQILNAQAELDTHTQTVVNPLTEKRDAAQERVDAATSLVKRRAAQTELDDAQARLNLATRQQDGLRELVLLAKDLAKASQESLESMQKYNQEKARNESFGKEFASQASAIKQITADINEFIKRVSLLPNAGVLTARFGQEGVVAGGKAMGFDLKPQGRDQRLLIEQAGRMEALIADLENRRVINPGVAGNLRAGVNAGRLGREMDLVSSDQLLQKVSATNEFIIAVMNLGKAIEQGAALAKQNGLMNEQQGAWVALNAQLKAAGFNTKTLADELKIISQNEAALISQLDPVRDKDQIALIVQQSQGKRDMAIFSSSLAGLMREARGGFVDDRVYGTGVNRRTGKQLNFDANMINLQEERDRKKAEILANKKMTPEEQAQAMAAINESFEKGMISQLASMVPKNRGRTTLEGIESFHSTIQQSLTNDPSVQIEEKQLQTLEKILEALLKKDESNLGPEEKAQLGKWRAALPKPDVGKPDPMLPDPEVIKKRDQLKAVWEADKKAKDDLSLAQDKARKSKEWSDLEEQKKWINLEVEDAHQAGNKDTEADARSRLEEVNTKIKGIKADVHRDNSGAFGVEAGTQLENAENAAARAAAAKNEAEKSAGIKTGGIFRAGFDQTAQSGSIPGRVVDERISMSIEKMQLGLESKLDKLTDLWEDIARDGLPARMS